MLRVFKLPVAIKLGIVFQLIAINNYSETFTNK